MNRKGISLIEILLSMALFAIIFLVASSIMLGIVRSDAKSRRQEIFEQVKNDVQSELVNSIKWAKEINLDQPNEINIDGIVIKLEGSQRITRQGSPITSDSVRITKFQVKELGPGVDNISLKIDIDMENADNPTIKDTFVIVATKRSTKIVE